MPKSKKKGTFYTLLGKIGDILLIPIVVLALFTSLLIFNQQKANSVPMFLGIGIVRVLSGSMSNYCEEAKRNFDVGERVFIRASTDYQVGDVIVFYNVKDSADTYKTINLTEITDEVVVVKDKDGNIVKNEDGSNKTTTYNYSPVKEDGKVKFDSELLNTIQSKKVGEKFIVNETEYTKQAVPQTRMTKKDASKKNSTVNFHQIVQIKVDESGAIFYVTKGNNNSSADSTYIRKDFVIGKYISTPKWISSILKWMASSSGMIFCVCIPLGILVILETLSLIEQINFAMIERKLLNGTAYWQDKEVQRLMRTDEMEKVVRIIYYIKVPKEDREDLKNFLWFTKGNLTKKEQHEIRLVEQSWDIFDKKGEREYLIFWLNNIKGRWNKKQISNELNALTYKQLLG